MSDPDLRDPRLDGAYGETPRDEPPAALDERIRAAARRAVAARPESAAAQARRSWASRWRVPLSIAASVVVAVTVSYMMQEEQALKSRIDAPFSAPVSPPPAPATGEPEAKKREMDAKPAEAAPAPPVTLQKRQVPAEAQAPAAPAAQAPKRAEPAVPRPDLESRRANEATGRAAEVAPAPAPPAQGAIQSAPSAPAAAPEPARAPLMREERSRPGASDEASGRLSRDRELSDRPAAREAVPAPAPASKTAAPAATRTPEAWLEDIRRLKAQGRDAEAAAELAEFRRRYPDFALPADLAR